MFSPTLSSFRHFGVDHIRRPAVRCPKSGTRDHPGYTSFESLCIEVSLKASIVDVLHHPLMMPSLSSWPSLEMVVLAALHVLSTRTACAAHAASCSIIRGASGFFAQFKPSEACTHFSSTYDSIRVQ